MFILSYIIAYLLFSSRSFSVIHNTLILLGYLGVFIAGFFYAYGFTAAPATVMLLILAKEQNLFLAGLIGGLGALLSDLVIFLFIRNTFSDEIEELSKKQSFWYNKEKTPNNFRKYLLATFAGFIIASPFPTEIGVTLMTLLRDISIKKFTIIAYFLHTAGIFIILLIGNII